MSDHRGRLLMAALGFAGSPPSYCSTPGGELGERLVDAPTDAPEPAGFLEVRHDVTAAPLDVAPPTRRRRVENPLTLPAEYRINERGMARQGFDLQLTRYDERGWRATFYTTGMEHSPTSTTGTGWEPTPWHASQRALGSNQ